MSEKEKRQVSKNYNIEEPYMDFDFATISAYDCTGLIPARDRANDEAENYEGLYPYLPPNNEFENNENSRDK